MNFIHGSKTRTKAAIKKIPGVKTAVSLLRSRPQTENPFLRSAPPGHYYSPIPDLEYVRTRRESLFSRARTSCPGVDLGLDGQMALIREFGKYYGELPFSKTPGNGLRYGFDNPSFGHGSAVVLYSVLRHFQPRRIIEVGSGHSSAAMLDVNDRFLGGKTRFTFVEPYPERLLERMNAEDRKRHEIRVDIAQNVAPSLFAELERNDILFIDSSHVAKIGSDVVYLLTEILPILQTGVIVHIHDIYWPFEYPEDWVFGGRAWNEAYMVKAFLQFNGAFQILLFNSYLAIHQRDFMQRMLPMFLPDAGSSLWLRKIS